MFTGFRVSRFHFFQLDPNINSDSAVLRIAVGSDVFRIGS